MKRKTLARWTKQEKRIIRLMYRAGLLENNLKDGKRPMRPVDVFYWAKYRPVHKTNWKKPQRVPRLPEVHFSYLDYYGEGNESAVTTHSEFCRCSEFDCPHSKMKLKSRHRLIAHLKTLPVFRNDHAINHVLRRYYEEW